MHFADDLIEEIIKKKSYLCVGLDPQLRYIPPHIRRWAVKEYGPGYRAVAEAFIIFNIAIINATYPFALAYKPQMAFYEKYGHHGVRAFEETLAYLDSMDLLSLTTEDAKREDGGDTADAYADGHMGFVDVIGKKGELIQLPSPYNVGAITVTPWICDPNFDSFLRVASENGKGFFVVTRTSFKPNSFLQDMIDKEPGLPAWQVLAKAVSKMGEPLKGKSGYSSVGIVLGATQGSDDAEIMRKLIPYGFKLKPGFGFQGAGPDEAVAGINDDGFGILPNNSRAVSFAWHPVVRKKLGLPEDFDPRGFTGASADVAKDCRDKLNAAVEKRIGFLPWNK